MADVDKSLRALIRGVTSDNYWVLPAINVIGVAVAFILGGWLIGAIGVGVFLLLVIAMLGRSLWLRPTDAQSLVVGESSSEPETLRPPAPTEGAGLPGDERPDVSETVDGAVLVGRMQDSGEHQPANHDAPEEEDDAGAAEPSPNPVQVASQAAVEGRFEEARATFEVWITEPDDEDTQVERRAITLWFLDWRGDPDALLELRALADSRPDHPEPIVQLAEALERRREARSAASEIASRREHVTVGVIRLLLKEADIRNDVGDFDRALELAQGALLDVQNLAPKQAAAAYREMGRALEGLDRTLEALVFFEQSLGADPTNQWTRFRTAWLYAHNEHPQAAVFHYGVYLANSPESAGAINNLGVALASLGLKGEAVERYKRASELGEDYAPGNLALLLAGAGFLDEAESQIQPRPEQSSALSKHSAEAAEQVAKQRIKESEGLGAARAGGEVISEYFRSLASAQESGLPIGSWSFSLGFEVSFEARDEESVEGSTGSGSDKVAVTISRAPRGLKLTIRRGTLFARESTGLAALVDGEILGFVKNWENSEDNISVTRVTGTDATNSSPT